MNSAIKQIFSEENGQLSCGRVLTGFTTLATLLFMGYFLVTTNKFPDYDVILALSVFMMAPYGTNKASEVVSNMKDIITRKQAPVSTNSSTVNPIQA